MNIISVLGGIISTTIFIGIVYLALKYTEKITSFFQMLL